MSNLILEQAKRETGASCGASPDQQRRLQQRVLAQLQQIGSGRVLVEVACCFRAETDFSGLFKWLDLTTKVNPLAPGGRGTPADASRRRSSAPHTRDTEQERAQSEARDWEHKGCDRFVGERARR